MAQIRDYLFIYRHPVHSEFSYFHGIRLRDPHDSIISGGVYYDDFATAAAAYLRDVWKGERPVLIARDRDRNDVWRWGPDLSLENPNPTPDLPF